MYIDTPVNKQYDSKKEQALKHLEELSIKTVGEIPILDDPNTEQKDFIKTKKWVTKHD
jgi:hypothetical protein